MVTASTSAIRRTVAADLLRRANREGCTLLLGARLVDEVGPVVVDVVDGIVDGALVVVMVIQLVVIVLVSHFQE